MCWRWQRCWRCWQAAVPAQPGPKSQRKARTTSGASMLQAGKSGEEVAADAGLRAGVKKREDRRSGRVLCGIPHRGEALDQMLQFGRVLEVGDIETSRDGCGLL